MNTDGITLYRKTLVPASQGSAGEPVVMSTRQGRDRYYTVIEDNDHGEMLLDFGRRRDEIVERAVTLSRWRVSDLFARAEKIEAALAQGLA
jgi:hypothetical protein